MEYIYLFGYLFLLTICAWTDNKTRLISPYPIIGMWLITAFNGVNLLFVVLTFVAVWFTAEVAKKYGRELFSFGDVLGIPTFAGFMLYFASVLGMVAFAIPIIIASAIAWFYRDKNGTRPMYVDLFVMYLGWLLLALCSKYISFS